MGIEFLLKFELERSCIVFILGARVKGIVILDATNALLQLIRKHYCRLSDRDGVLKDWH
jgi:hypothetical protein